MNEPYVFVTVGTTKFDLLCEMVTSTEILDIFVLKGYKRLLVQKGGGKFINSKDHTGIIIQCYDFKSSIQDDLKNASLVIGHAGAGSILETLSYNKPLVVVVNELLMDNHQSELAKKMCEERHLYYSVCSTLKDTLTNCDFSKLRKMTPANPKTFGDYVDKFMGVIS